MLLGGDRGILTDCLVRILRKPATSLADPFPNPTVVPKAFAQDNAADYESEFVIVIGKTAKNVPEEEAMDYVLGYTAANDVSSRAQQFAQSQWCYSKGFDGACPLGPAFVPKEAMPRIGEVAIKGARNGKVCQDSKLEYESIVPAHGTRSHRLRADIISCLN